MQLFQIEQRQIADILIIDRARTDVGDITGLAKSIEMVGQLNPILIDSNNKLIDGLNRLKAIESLDRTTIEVRIVDGITNADHTLIELLANMDRKEFLWHEEIELKHKIHNFWVAAASEAGNNWGYRETSKRLNCSLGGLSTDLAFCEALKIFPMLKEQTTKGRAKEAYKALGEQAKALQRMDNFSPEEKERLTNLQTGNIKIPAKNTAPNTAIEKTKQLGKELSLDAQNKADADQTKVPEAVYVAENYKTFINKIPDNSVGMVELDPPYAIDFNTNYGKTSKIESKATDWTEKELFEFYFHYLPVIYTKMLDSSWVLCWTGKEHVVEIQKIATEIGFSIQQPGVWVKPGGSTNQPKRNLISNWEMYMLFRKGDATFNTPSLPSAIQMNTVNNAKRIHQWEKPIELYDHFIKAMGKPGTIFLSPFAGSGNCLIAAAKAKMMPVGCDKSQKYIPQFYSNLSNYLGLDVKISGR